MIEELHIKKLENFRSTKISFAKYNIFLGKNGEGKSFLMKMLTDNSQIANLEGVTIIKNGNEFRANRVNGDNKSLYVPETRVYPHFSNINLNISTGGFHDIQPSNVFSNLWRDKEFRKKYSIIFQKLFDREVVADVNSESGAHLFYKHGLIPKNPQQDGYGILNHMQLYHILLNPNYNEFLIEEPTFGFHMSLVKSFVTDLISEQFNKKQYIFSSQDLVFILEFIKLWQERDDCKIFKFDSIDGKMTVAEVTELEAIASSMSDDEFPTVQDINLLKTIFIR